MKKINYIMVTALFIVFLLGNNEGLKAQKEKGKSVITAGVGYSLVGAIMTAAKDAVNAAPNTEVTATKTPVIVGMYDFALADQFSLGAAYSYQSLTLRYNAYEDDNGGIHVGNYKDMLTRQNYAIRALFHFGQNESLDMYSGLRLGYTMWSYNTSRVDNPDWSSGKLGNSIWPQVLFGMRYFFIPNLGFNFEFAIGPTYYTMIGINAQF